MPERPPNRPPATVTVIKLAWCCLLASVVAAGLMFPVVGGFGLMSNRASDVVANGSAQLVEGEVPGVSTMVDAKGNVIAWLYSQRRFEVPGDQIANTMKLAIVSIEDKRFAEHNGVDWTGLASAAWDNAINAVQGKRARGASTLSMQLAGMLEPASEVSGASRSFAQKWDLHTLNDQLVFRQINACLMPFQHIQAQQ